MGCDIHFHAEIKLAGVWQHLTAPNIMRDYELFNVLSGVRGEGPGFAKLGMPKDATEITRYCHTVDDTDAHTVGWLDAVAIGKAYEAMEKIYQRRHHTGSFEWDFAEATGWFQGNSLQEIANCCVEKKTKDLHLDLITDIRFIVWYDS